ncbi:MAG: helix-turn-helix domain-containing protein [Nocardioidaceae bacterium]
MGASAPRLEGAFTRLRDAEFGHAVALERWARRSHISGGYWATSTEAAHILGVNRSRIGQLVAIGRLPELRTPTRRRLYRRAQIEDIANARNLRRFGAAPGDPRQAVRAVTT